jgi:hypothetical protein
MEQQVTSNPASSTTRRSRHRRQRRRRQRAPEAAIASVAPEIATVPEAVIPEAVIPEAVVSETVIPETVVPEAVIPEAVVPQTPSLTHTEYKDNIKKLYDEYAKCRDKQIKNKLAIVAYEYLLQPEMLRASSSQWFITWRASIWYHIINDIKSASDKYYVQEAASTIDNILESAGRYNVSASKFIEIYDWTINFMSDRTDYTTCYAASFVAYMNKLSTDTWNGVPTEKKESICSKVIEWKEHPKSADYGLFEKCKYFIEKYIV